jgi:tryptophan halogenase
MEVPESLARRIQMFRERGYAYQGDSELFRVDSWVQVMLGQGIKPAAYHQITQSMSKAELARVLTAVKTPIAQTLERLPTHQQFLDQYCKADI